MIALFLLAGCGGGGGTRAVPRLPPMPVTQLRSVTYIEEDNWDAYAHGLREALPQIRGAGFNSVWLVLTWAQFEPKPLADPPDFDTHSFRVLRGVLADLAAHRMRAIIGLNYLGKGWSPQGIDPCRWITDRRFERAFEGYVRGFLERIRPYHNVVYILLFTETAQTCEEHPFDVAPQLAARLRPTLGSLPSRLPPELRSQFEIGYHDDNLINLDWANGATPIASPNPFDFLSMTAYGLDHDTRAGITRELDERIGRFRAHYPRTPLIIGELGASRCDGSARNQARVDAAIVSYALHRHLGFNVWHWKPVRREDTCRDPAFMALSITDPAGKLNSAGVALRKLLASK